MDLGGTNFRVLLVTLVPTQTPTFQQQIYKIPEDMMHGTGEQVWPMWPSPSLLASPTIPPPLSTILPSLLSHPFSTIPPIYYFHLSTIPPICHSSLCHSLYPSHSLISPYYHTLTPGGGDWGGKIPPPPHNFGKSRLGVRGGKKEKEGKKGKKRKGEIEKSERKEKEKKRKREREEKEEKIVN